MKKPLQVNFYKKKSALRLQISNHTNYDIGCMFFTFSKAKGRSGAESGYDWEDNSITVKISFNDVLSLLSSFTYFENVQLYHEFNNCIKVVDVQFKTDNSGSVFLSVKETDNDNKKNNNISVLLTKSEVLGLVIFLRQGLVKMYNW